MLGGVYCIYYNDVGSGEGSESFWVLQWSDQALALDYTCVDHHPCAYLNADMCRRRQATSKYVMNGPRSRAQSMAMVIGLCSSILHSGCTCSGLDVKQCLDMLRTGAGARARRHPKWTVDLPSITSFGASRLAHILETLLKPRTNCLSHYLKLGVSSSYCSRHPIPMPLANTTPSDFNHVRALSSSPPARLSHLT